MSDDHGNEAREEYHVDGGDVTPGGDGVEEDDQAVVMRREFLEVQVDELEEGVIPNIKREPRLPCKTIFQKSSLNYFSAMVYFHHLCNSN